MGLRAYGVRGVVFRDIQCSGLKDPEKLSKNGLHKGLHGGPLRGLYRGLL